MLKMSTFSDGCFNIGSKTNVETPLEPMLKPFYVIVLEGKVFTFYILFY